MKIFFASHNLDKKKEIEYILSSQKILVLYINDYPDYPEVEETGTTLAMNAELKAIAGFEHTGLPSFAEDTGLEVDFLNGEPGIYAARYAGENATYSDNCKKLLDKLNGVHKENRKARFKTVLSFITKDGIKNFKGECRGLITKTASGENGFGYDPIFMPEGYNQTFAQLSKEIKNQISHRAIAVKEFADYLKEFYGA